MEKFDVVVVGGGIGGLMAAYRLTEQGNKKVLLLERGKELSHRLCPIVTKKVAKCMGCNPCAIMVGLAGAGAFSDGKYVISTEYGGWLTEYLPAATVLNYIEQADRIMVSFGATTHRFMPNDNLKLLCLEHDLHMQQAELKHLGTDENYNTMMQLIEHIRKKVTIRCNCLVTDMDKEQATVTYQSEGRQEIVAAGNIIIAVGRAGSRFFSDWCIKNGITMENNQVDVGVRVELPAIIWDKFSKEIYEPKIWYRSKQYGDITRMFCFNERGSVVVENTDGVLTVNGHAYRDAAKKTTNSNFAMLTTTKFTQPFKEPIEYARYVASLANKISGGSVLVQRFGDLIKGRRTDDHRLAACTTHPSLQAVPGDLALCMPKRQLDNIVESLERLDLVAPGTANADTLLYGVECKYYSARPKTEHFLLSGCKHIYAVGDGAGITRSLSQAAANGLYVADLIVKSK